MGAVTLQRIGERNGDIGALLLTQFGWRRIEIDAGHRIGTIDAPPHLDGVEIDLHNALLAPNFLDQEGEIGLQALAQPRPFLPQEHVTGRLLADGACTALSLAFLGLELCFLYLLKVKAAMLQEQVVLAGHHRLRQVVADFFQRHPVMVDLRGLAIDNGLNTANQHQRRDIDGDILQYHHSQDGRGEKENQYVAHPAAKTLHFGGKDTTII